MKDGIVSIYNVELLLYRLTIHNQGDLVSVLDISPDGTKVIIGSLNKLKSYSLKLYDIGSGKSSLKAKGPFILPSIFDEHGDRILVTGIKVKSPAAKIGTGAAYLVGTMAVVTS